MSKANHTFAAPKNPHGYLVYHTRSGKPMTDEEWWALYNYVLAPAEPFIIEAIRRSISTSKQKEG